MACFFNSQFKEAASQKILEKRAKGKFFLGKLQAPQVLLETLF